MLFGKIIFIKKTGRDGSIYSLTEKSITIGRSEECQIRIHNPQVALHHCQLIVNANDQVKLKNLSNHTFLNGKALNVGEVILHHGDVFKIGDREARWEYIPSSQYYPNDHPSSGRLVAVVIPQQRPMGSKVIPHASTSFLSESKQIPQGTKRRFSERCVSELGSSNKVQKCNSTSKIRNSLGSLLFQDQNYQSGKMMLTPKGKSRKSMSDVNDFSYSKSLKAGLSEVNHSPWKVKISTPPFNPKPVRRKSTPIKKVLPMTLADKSGKSLRQSALIKTPNLKAITECSPKENESSKGTNMNLIDFSSPDKSKTNLMVTPKSTGSKPERLVRSEKKLNVKGRDSLVGMSLKVGRLSLAAKAAGKTPRISLLRSSQKKLSRKSASASLNSSNQEKKRNSNAAQIESFSGYTPQKKASGGRNSLRKSVLSKNTPIIDLSSSREGTTSSSRSTKTFSNKKVASLKKDNSSTSITPNVTPKRSRQSKIAERSSYKSSPSQPKEVFNSSSSRKLFNSSDFLANESAEKAAQKLKTINPKKPDKNKKAALLVLGKAGRKHMHSQNVVLLKNKLVKKAIKQSETTKKNLKSKCVTRKKVKTIKALKKKGTSKATGIRAGRKKVLGIEGSITGVDQIARKSGEIEEQMDSYITSKKTPKSRRTSSKSCNSVPKTRKSLNLQETTPTHARTLKNSSTLTETKGEISITKLTSRETPLKRSLQQKTVQENLAVKEKLIKNANVDESLMKQAHGLELISPKTVKPKSGSERSDIPSKVTKYLRASSLKVETPEKSPEEAILSPKNKKTPKRSPKGALRSPKNVKTPQKSPGRVVTSPKNVKTPQKSPGRAVTSPKNVKTPQKSPGRSVTSPKNVKTPQKSPGRSVTSPKNVKTPQKSPGRAVTSLKNVKTPQKSPGRAVTSLKNVKTPQKSPGRSVTSPKNVKTPQKSPGRAVTSPKNIKTPEQTLEDRMPSAKSTDKNIKISPRRIKTPEISPKTTRLVEKTHILLTPPDKIHLKSPNTKSSEETLKSVTEGKTTPVNSPKSLKTPRTDKTAKLLKTKETSLKSMKMELTSPKMDKAPLNLLTPSTNESPKLSPKLKTLDGYFLGSNRRCSKRLSSKNDVGKPDYMELSPTALGLIPKNIEEMFKTPKEKKKRRSTSLTTPKNNCTTGIIKSASTMKIRNRKSVRFSSKNLAIHLDLMTNGTPFKFEDIHTPNISLDVFVSPLMNSSIRDSNSNTSPKYSEEQEDNGSTGKRSYRELEPEGSDVKKSKCARKLLQSPDLRKTPQLISLGNKRRMQRETPSPSPKRTKRISNSFKNYQIELDNDKSRTKAMKLQKSPQNDMIDLEGVNKLLKTPRVQRSPKNDLSNVDGVRKLLKTPRIQRSPKNELNDLRGVKKLLATPKYPKSPKNELTDLRGVKKLLGTPKYPKSPKNELTDLRGVKKLLGTPKYQKGPKNELNDLRGVKKLLGSPKFQKEPKNELTDFKGLKKLLTTPKVLKAPKNDLNDLRGVKKLLTTPKLQKGPRNSLSDLRGVKVLLGSPKVQKSPKNKLDDLRGVKNLFSTPQMQKSPKNDLSDLEGVLSLLKTPRVQKNLNVGKSGSVRKEPKAQKGPKNDLSDLRGVKELFESSRVQKSHENDLLNLSGVKELYQSEVVDEMNAQMFSPKRTYGRSAKPVASVQELLTTDSSTRVSKRRANSSMLGLGSEDLKNFREITEDMKSPTATRSTRSRTALSGRKSLKTSEVEEKPMERSSSRKRTQKAADEAQNNPTSLKKVTRERKALKGTAHVRFVEPEEGNSVPNTEKPIGRRPRIAESKTESSSTEVIEEGVKTQTRKRGRSAASEFSEPSPPKLRAKGTRNKTTNLEETTKGGTRKSASKTTVEESKIKLPVKRSATKIKEKSRINSKTSEVQQKSAQITARKAGTKVALKDKEKVTDSETKISPRKTRSRSTAKATK